MVTHDEVVELMQLEITQASDADKGRVKPLIEAAYEDGEFSGESILPLLDRWGDRRVKA